jgi:hypothetical protein
MVCTVAGRYWIVLNDAGVSTVPHTVNVIDVLAGQRYG